MKKALVVMTTLIANMPFSSIAYSGGTTGGGSPPSMEETLKLLSASQGRDVGQLYQDKDLLGLGVKGHLPIDLKVTRDFSPMSLTVSAADFATLAATKGNIDALNTEGLMRSYKIEDSESLDSLILKDRRELARAAIK